ncbi:MAG: hypothetical protein KDK08_29220 [Rhizobiaceae bacterium]|nr:hypothetical protein [Rhizobiaceae bacterium]
MLRALVILVAVIATASLLLSGISQKSSTDDAYTSVETPLGTIHASELDHVYIVPALVKGNEFHEDRAASVKLVWAQSSIPGNRDQRMRKLKERATAVAAKECQLLLALVEECRVLSATPDQTGNEASIRMRFAFIPRSSFGTLPKGDNLWLDKLVLEYKDFNHALGEDSDKATSDRVAIYAEIARDCREAADVYGHCYLGDIRIDADLYGTKGKYQVRTTGRAIVAILRQRSVTLPGSQ